MGCILSIGSIDRLINNPPTGPPHHRYESPLCGYFSYLSRYQPLPAPSQKANARKSKGKGKSTSNKDGGVPLCANAVDALIHHVVRAVAAAAPEVGSGWVRIYRSCVSCHIIMYLCAGVFERYITFEPLLRGPRTYTKTSVTSSVVRTPGQVAARVTHAEWWAHTRPHASGHALHFDTDEQGLREEGA